MEKQELVDIRELALRYLRAWKWFVLSVAIFVALAFVYLKVTTPIYQINANVLIKDEDSKKNMGSSMMKNFSFGFPGSMDVEDELHVISSHTIMRQTVEDLDLNISYTEVKYGFIKRDHYKTNVFQLIPKTQFLDTLSTGLEFKIKASSDNNFTCNIKEKNKTIGKYHFTQLPANISTPYGDFVLTTTQYYKKNKSYTYLVNVFGSNIAAESLSKNVNISLASKKANVISLSTTTANTGQGKDILNTIIGLYNKDAITEKNLVAQNTAKFIEDRLRIISTELSDVESEVEGYKKKNNLFDVEVEAKLMLEENKDYKIKMVEVQTQLNIAKLLQNYIKNKENQYSLIPMNLGITDKGAIEAIQSYNEMLLARLKMLQNTKENNPVIISMNEEIQAMRANVFLSIENVRKSFQIALNDLKQQEDKFLSKFHNAPTIEKEFLDIKRKQAIKEQLFLFLMEKREENALTLAVTAPKAKIVDHAYVINKPVEPKRTSILMIALCVGLFLPVVLIYIRDLFRVNFESKTELERLTKLPILGEICVNDTKEQVVVKEGANNSISELFRLIRTNIQFILNRKEQKVILITSTVSGEGKSFFAINFAMSLSLLKDKKVVLVGLDIRNPKLIEYLEMSAKTIGITNYLASEELQPQNIAIHSTQNGNLDIIVSGPVPPNPSELLLSDRLEKMFEYLRSKYDYIVVDSAPVGMVSDSFTLDRISDATIYICRTKFSKREHIKFAEAVVAQGKLKKVSLVINGTDTHTGYGYGYGKKE